MKTKHLLFVALCGLVTCTACKQTPESYTLTGHIEGLPDSVHVQLIPISHDDEQPLADTLATNGRFTLTGKVNEPRAVWLKVKDANGARRLMLENTTIHINGTVRGDSIGNTLNYNLESLNITGSPLSTRYDSLMTVQQRMDSIYQDKAQRYADASLEERTEADRQFFHLVDSTYHSTVMSQKDSYWGPLLMISLTVFLTNDMKSWYEDLTPEAQASYYGQLVQEELYPAGVIGSKVTDFTLKNDNNEEITLTSICERKQYVLIDFWASWCKPCRKEIPNLKRLYKKYADKGFEIVSISIDKKKSDWEKALKEEQLPWPNFLDETGVADLYKVRFIPTMYLVNSQGILVGENLFEQELEDKLTELFD